MISAFAARPLEAAKGGLGWGDIEPGAVRVFGVSRVIAQRDT